MYCTAVPIIFTRSPSRTHFKSPTRAEICFAVKLFLPRRSAQKGVNTQCAEPVTGSSSIPYLGAKKTADKIYFVTESCNNNTARIYFTHGIEVRADSFYLVFR